MELLCSAATQQVAQTMESTLTALVMLRRSASACYHFHMYIGSNYVCTHILSVATIRRCTDCSTNLKMMSTCQSAAQGQ